MNPIEDWLTHGQGFDRADYLIMVLAAVAVIVSAVWIKKGVDDGDSDD